MRSEEGAHLVFPLLIVVISDAVNHSVPFSQQILRSVVEAPPDDSEGFARRIEIRHLQTCGAQEYAAQNIFAEVAVHREKWIIERSRGEEALEGAVRDGIATADAAFAEAISVRGSLEDEPAEAATPLEKSDARTNTIQ